MGLVNYIGHGSTEIWAGGLLSSTDALALLNGLKAPVVIAMTCLNGYFQDVYTNSLAEALMNAPGGGAVAGTGLFRADRVGATVGHGPGIDSRSVWESACNAG